MEYRTPLWSAGQHQLGETHTGSLPQIKGWIAVRSAYSNGAADGAFSIGDTYFTNADSETGGTSWRGIYEFDALKSSIAYSRSDNSVLPRSIYMNYVIKY